MSLAHQQLVDQMIPVKGSWKVEMEQNFDQIDFVLIAIPLKVNKFH